MKKVFISILSVTILASCGGKTDGLALLKAERAKLKGEITILETSLKSLEVKIYDLDTTNNAALARVEVSKSLIKPFSEEVTFQGSIEANKNVMVAPQSSGAITNIYVKEGEYVSAGKSLASLDSDILSKNVKEVEKALELANYMLEKQTRLKEQEVGTELQYTQAKNQKESLEIKLATLNAQASKNIVSSPISGYVDKIFPNIGEMASPQMPMFRVLNLDKVTVVSEVSENYLNSIKSGSSVSVYFPSIDYRLNNLKVTRVGRFINPTNRTFPIQIDIVNTSGRILPNLLAEVKVTKKFTEKALLVPSKSIFEDNKGEKFLYVVKDGKASKKIIEVDFVEGDTTQLKSGIEEGEGVIVRGGNAIIDGEKIEVVN
jgi:membrane fusion protein (multidrug efflux system)